MNKPKIYIKIPKTIEAIQYTGDNLEAIMEFTGNNILLKGIDNLDGRCNSNMNLISKETPIIHTLEGDFIISPMDYVIKGIKGEFYPCKPDIFEESYTLFENEEKAFSMRSI